MQVWLAYCDGNSFSGNADQPVNYYGHNLYFRGHRIVDEVMAAVNANAMKGPAQWSAAQKVVLTGCSAGGLSTYLHADYVYNSFVKPLAPSASYYVIPISGFFLDSPNVLGQHVYAQQIQVIHALSNASAPGSVNDACIAANPGATWKCNMAQVSDSALRMRISNMRVIELTFPLLNIPFSCTAVHSALHPVPYLWPELHLRQLADGLRADA